MRLVWEREEFNDIKCFFIRVIMESNHGLDDLVPCIISHYINLAKYEENHVNLPRVAKLCIYGARDSVVLLGKRYFNRAELIDEKLDFCLIEDTPTTRQHIVDLLYTLFMDGIRKDASFVSARNKLLDTARRLRYGDILWLNMYRLSPLDCANPDKVTTFILLDYLCTIAAPEFYIRSYCKQYEMRTATLFRCVFSLLLRQESHKEAAYLYYHVMHRCGIQDPWFHIGKTIKAGNLYTQYKKMLLEFAHIQHDSIKTYTNQSFGTP